MPRREQGVALVSVLWMLLLLSSLAAAAAYTVRAESLITHQVVALSRAQGAADAGIVYAISNLSDEMPGRHPGLDGPALPWEFDGIAVTITVQNEFARIDLNQAPDALLQQFLQARGLQPDAAAELVQHLRFAQHRQPLLAVEELRQIPGWAAQNSACWQDSLTVYSGQSSVEELNSPKSGRAPTPTSLAGRVVRIRATAAVSSEVTVTREWVGRLTGDSRSPVLTMLWHQQQPDTSRCQESAQAPAKCGGEFAAPFCIG